MTILPVVRHDTLSLALTEEKKTENLSEQDVLELSVQQVKAVLDLQATYTKDVVNIPINKLRCYGDDMGECRRLEENIKMDLKEICVNGLSYSTILEVE